MSRLSVVKEWARHIKRDVIAVYLAARDPRTPPFVRVLALAIAAYARSPIDLIPDFIPVVGYLDDLLIVPLGLLAVIHLLPADVPAYWWCNSTTKATPLARWAALGFLAWGCAPPPVDPVMTDGWERAAPAAVGIDGAQLDSLTLAIQRQDYPNVHALLIVKDGLLVHEQYFEGTDVRRGVGPQGHVVFDATMRHDVRSVTKSVTSALVGIAIGDGLLESVDQPVFDLFPEHAEFATPAKRGVTLRHLLTMSSGFAWNEAVSYADTSNDERRMNRSTDPVQFVLSRPLVAAPGTVFNYSGGSPQLLAAAVQRAAGRPLLEYARAMLFDPLGITDVEWVHDSSDVPSAASGLRMRPVDAAKLGVLYLDAGRWRGRQVIPASWVSATRTRQMALPAAESDSGRHGYSFLWWHSRLATPRGDIEVLNASGNGGQNIFVVPQFRLVVTVFGGRYDAGDYVTEDILVDQIIRALR